jgi:aspartate 1-decarboxylase
MLTQVLKAKIHRATVTQAELDYVGSITIDEALMEASGIREYERVQVVDINNGNRLETYVIAGEKDSGVICLNGAAARLVEIGDKVIIMAYVLLNDEELETHFPTVVFVDHDNKPAHIANYEKHGLLVDQEGYNTETL